MNVTWILEPGLFPEYYAALIAAIALKGDQFQSLPLFYTECEWGNTDRFYDELSPKGNCVVCHASFEFTSLVAQDELWIPGTFGVNEKYDYSSFFPGVSNYLLNRDCEFVKYADLQKESHRLFSKFSIDGHIFIRPDAGNKPFTGKLFAQSELAGSRFPQWRLNPTSTLIISYPQNIISEWRFIVADQQIITASRYRECGVLSLSTNVPSNAWDFAGEVARKVPQPDRVWVLDVCQTASGELYVVELNGISSANWYCCDVESIVPIVSRIALEEWALNRL